MDNRADIRARRSSGVGNRLVSGCKSDSRHIVIWPFVMGLVSIALGMEVLIGSAFRLSLSRLGRDVEWLPAANAIYRTDFRLTMLVAPYPLLTIGGVLLFLRARGGMCLHALYAGASAIMLVLTFALSWREFPLSDYWLSTAAVAQSGSVPYVIYGSLVGVWLVRPHTWRDWRHVRRAGSGLLERAERGHQTLDRVIGLFGVAMGCHMMVGAAGNFVSVCLYTRCLDGNDAPLLNVMARVLLAIPYVEYIRDVVPLGLGLSAGVAGIAFLRQVRFGVVSMLASGILCGAWCIGLIAFWPKEIPFVRCSLWGWDHYAWAHPTMPIVHYWALAYPLLVVGFLLWRSIRGARRLASVGAPGGPVKAWRNVALAALRVVLVLLPVFLALWGYLGRGD